MQVHEIRTWAPAEIFSEGGAKPPTFEKVDAFSARRTKIRLFFGAPKAQTKFFAFFRRFSLQYIVNLMRAPKVVCLFNSANLRFFAPL